MNTCDTCKWWTRRKSAFSGEILKNGLCQHAKLNLGYNETWVGHEYSRIDGMYGVPPTTGPKFGCIHHESK